MYLKNLYKKNKMFRKVFVFWIFLWLFIIFLHQIVFFSNYQIQIIIILLLFIISFLICFELQNSKKNTYISILLFFLFVIYIIFILNSISLGYFYSFLFLFFWFLAVIINTKISIDNYIKISQLEIVNSIWYIFCVFLIISYLFLIITKYRYFPIDCDRIQKKTQSISDISTNNIFWNKKVSENIDILDIEISSKSDNFFLYKINTIKTNILDQILKDNNAYTMSICEYSITKIKEIFKNQKFIISTLFLIFLLLYPLFRLIIFVFQILAYLFIKFIFYIGLYKITNESILVEKIK